MPTCYTMGEDKIPTTMHISPFFHNDDVRMKTSRASGPGGMNASRRSTKVQIWVPVEKLILTEEQKKGLRAKYQKYINSEDELEASCEEERSQEENMDNATQHMTDLIAKAIAVKAPRIPTEVPRPAMQEAVHQRRLRYMKSKDRKDSKRTSNTEIQKLFEEEGK